MSSWRGAGAAGGADRRRKYLQKYKTAWEADVRFKGWLAPSKTSTTSALCTSCDKEINIAAGRDSLLRHTYSQKHQKCTDTFATRPQSTVTADPEGQDEGALGKDPESRRGGDAVEVKCVKKKKNLQKYKKGWEADVRFKGWLAPSKKSIYFATCTTCNRNINIACGKDILIRHSMTQVHGRNTRSLSKQQRISVTASLEEQGDESTGRQLTKTDENTRPSGLSYRRKWMEHPLFKNWLTLLEGPMGPVAMCTVCDRTFSNFKRLGMLQHSQCRNHQILMDRKPNDEMCLYRISSKLWNHFVRLDSDTARCKYCKQELSHENSTSELEEHLNSEHPNVKYADTQVRSTEAILKALKIPTSKKTKLSSMIKKKFKISSRPQIVPGEENEATDHEVEEVIVDYSDASVPEEDTYLEEQHLETDDESKILNERNFVPNNIIPEDVTYVEDPFAESDGDQFEHSKISGDRKFVPNKTVKIDEIIKQIGAPVDKDNSIEHFGRYVASLLYNMPVELANQIQIDVVSLMLSAKNKYEQKNVTSTAAVDASTIDMNVTATEDTGS